MVMGETIALILALLLALYGCAQLIRRLCLWAVRCPACVTCWRLAVPKKSAELAPLFRCLQAQAVWDDPGCEGTLVLLPSMSMAQRQAMASLVRENPVVTPVTLEELTALLRADEEL